MKNKQGKTVCERLNEDIEHARSAKTKREKRLLAAKAIGAVDFAIEFNLITYAEWEQYIGKLFPLI